MRVGGGFNAKAVDKHCMNIGIFTIMLRNGGTERVAAQLSRIWTALGHNIVFFTLEQRHENDFPHECIARECAVDGCWKADDVERLQKKYALDLVIVNGGWNNDWVCPVVCRFKELNVRSLAILHHAFNNWAFSGCNIGDFDKEELLAHLDCLVCVDKIQALWWSRRHSCVAYMPNPCGVDAGVDIAESGRPRKHRIVWVGRANDWGKRLNLAIDVFRLVRKKIPDAALMVVGALPKRWKCNEPGIVFTGYLPSAIKAMQSASVHLVTTLWEVTVPQVVLEARAIGILTVSFDLPVLRNEEGICLGKDSAEVSDLIVDILVKRHWAETSRLDTDRNEDIGRRWKELLAMLESGNLTAYLTEKSHEYVNVEQYEKLIDEVQRSEKFIAETHFPTLQRVRRWKGRLQRVKEILGL